MRAYCAGMAPLHMSGGRAQFIERAGEYYDIVEGM